MPWPLDQPVRLDFTTYSDAAHTTPADATTVTLDILTPDGTTTTVTLTPPGITHDDTGLYHYDYLPPLPGHYAYHWKATGTVATAEDGEFDVRPKYDPAVISVEDARTHLKDPGLDAEQLRGFIDAVTEVVEGIVGPVLPAVHVETYRNPGGEILLRAYPATSVATVIEYGYTGTGTTLTATTLGTLPYPAAGYGFDPDTGVVTRYANGSVSRFLGDVVVTYTAGRTTVTPAVRMAVLEGVRLLWTKSQGMGAVEYPVSLSEIDRSYLATLLAGSARVGSVA